MNSEPEPEVVLASLLERLPEVSDDDASPEVRSLFADVRTLLRVPFVGSLLRRLANDPPLLRSLWFALRPALHTRYFQRECDRLRRHALFASPHPDFGAAHRAQLLARGLDEAEVVRIAWANETVHYVLPAYLLLAAAGALALRDGGEGGARLRPEDLRPLGPGAAGAAAARLDPVALAGLGAALRERVEALRAAHDHPFVASYFLALGHWPVYLERACDDLLTIVGSPRYRAASSVLSTLAEVAARSFPGPVRLECAKLAPAEAAALLGFFHQRLLPDLLLDAAFLRALLEGERRARTNSLSLTATG